MSWRVVKNGEDCGTYTKQAVAAKEAQRLADRYKCEVQVVKATKKKPAYEPTPYAGAAETHHGELTITGLLPRDATLLYEELRHIGWKSQLSPDGTVKTLAYLNAVRHIINKLKLQGAVIT